MKVNVSDALEALGLSCVVAGVWAEFGWAFGAIAAGASLVLAGAAVGGGGK